ncbi:MAG: low specificity L-threonine aldolase, partial [Oscillospiraceae bacterium]|nr:low specificity L-threonine aldolase [Oscillospiraceae bacterium]
IRKECACPDAEVFYLPGGTQANATVIDFLLKGYQGVISAHTGHINTHEAGAIEAYGHKILAIEGVDGKISAESVKAYLDLYKADTAMEHLVQPGMVYISHPTEMGTFIQRLSSPR